MYNRLDRKKNPPDIIYCNKGGMLDLFDDAIKEVYIITDEEYDILAEALSEPSKVSKMFTQEAFSYKEAKQVLVFIKSLIK